jgi:hypothetical protein
MVGSKEEALEVWHTTVKVLAVVVRSKKGRSRGMQ